jgi:hypothetical protein
MIKNYAKTTKKEKLDQVKFQRLIDNQDYIQRSLAERPLLNDRYLGNTTSR